MDDVAADCGVIFEATVFLSHFNDLPDPRHPLDEVLLLSLLAVLAGAETFIDIARFGNKKLALLRRFRPFLDGTPVRRSRAAARARRTGPPCRPARA